MMSLTRIGGVERRANTGARLTFPSGAAAGAKVPIELLGLLKGKESRCGGYGGAHARIDMLRDMLPGTPDPLGVRFSSAGIFGLVKQETLPCLPLAKAAAQSANSTDFGDSHPSATTSSPARPKKCGRRDVSRSEILRA